jgi:hypothetical protein
VTGGLPSIQYTVATRRACPDGLDSGIKKLTTLFKINVVPKLRIYGTFVSTLQVALKHKVLSLNRKGAIPLRGSKCSWEYNTGISFG